MKPLVEDSELYNQISGSVDEMLLEIASNPNKFELIKDMTFQWKSENGQLKSTKIKDLRKVFIDKGYEYNRAIGGLSNKAKAAMMRSMRDTLQKCELIFLENANKDNTITAPDYKKLVYLQNKIDLDSDLKNNMNFFDTKFTINKPKDGLSIIPAGLSSRSFGSFLLLATLVNSNGVLVHKNGRSMKKTYIKEILGLSSDNAYSSLINEFVDANVIKTTYDTKLKVTTIYFNPYYIKIDAPLNYTMYSMFSSDLKKMLRPEHIRYFELQQNNGGTITVEE